MFADQIITTLFGGDYVGAKSIFLILLSWRVIDSYFGPVITLLDSIGRQRVVSNVMLQSALLAIGMQFSLAWAFGMVSLAVATAIAAILLKVRLWAEWLHIKRQSRESVDG